MRSGFFVPTPAPKCIVQKFSSRPNFANAYSITRKVERIRRYVLYPLMSLVLPATLWFKFGAHYWLIVPLVILTGMLLYSNYNYAFKDKSTGRFAFINRTARTIEITGNDEVIARTWPWFRQPERTIVLTPASLIVRRKEKLDFLPLRDQEAFVIPVDGQEIIVFTAAFGWQINVEQLFRRTTGEALR